MHQERFPMVGFDDLGTLCVRRHHVANPLCDCLAVSLTRLSLMRAEVRAPKEGVPVAKHLVHATVEATAPPRVCLVWPKVREQVVHVEEPIPEVEPKSAGTSVPVVGWGSAVMAVRVASEVIPLVMVVLLARSKRLVEMAEEVMHVEVLEVGTLATGSLSKGVLAVGVILLTLVLVTQHFVGLSNLLELFLGSLLLVLVRMVLHGQLPECLLNLPVCRCPVHSKQLIVVLAHLGFQQLNEQCRTERKSQK